MYLKPYGVVNKGQSMQENITAAKGKLKTNRIPTCGQRGIADQNLLAKRNLRPGVNYYGLLVMMIT